ncbi:hypothetical protein CYMTET_33687 [Cymbomonas tetramitiformis]|uniref:Uncharacterized protein n=1 Tax=Cymbomonas tetramitiformis TaxID=36881 RepID=A0AAE0FCI2_9CHLO|nr:hypothetical protein CYMTET_33687 [Cymbomonas tetramitiformis]
MAPLISTKLNPIAQVGLQPPAQAEIPGYPGGAEISSPGSLSETSEGELEEILEEGYGGVSPLYLDLCILGFLLVLLMVIYWLARLFWRNCLSRPYMRMVMSLLPKSEAIEYEMDLLEVDIEAQEAKLQAMPEFDHLIENIVETEKINFEIKNDPETIAELTRLRLSVDNHVFTARSTDKTEKPDASNAAALTKLRLMRKQEPKVLTKAENVDNPKAE